MYALSKYANGSVEEVLRKIDEGMLKIKEIKIFLQIILPKNIFLIIGQYAVNEQLRLQTLNMYFGAAQQSTQNPTQAATTRECG